jgi:hypothetical protein
VEVALVVVADDEAELVAVVVEVVGVAVGEVGVVEVAAVVIVGGAESTVAADDVAPACPGGEPPDSSSGRFLMDRKQEEGLLTDYPSITSLILNDLQFAFFIIFNFIIFISISERAKERWKKDGTFCLLVKELEELA